MHKSLRHTTLVVIALTLWFVAGGIGAHGHVCFDGQEPPISLHVGMTGEHLDHHPEEQHVDVDIDLSQSVLMKTSKIDLPLLIAVTLVLLIRIIFARSVSFYAVQYLRPTLRLRPPLRAPPAFPA